MAYARRAVSAESAGGVTDWTDLFPFCTLLNEC